MASALSRFPFQRLSTGYSHFIDGLLQIRQGFMRVNAFRHSCSGVAEYHLDGRFIGSCPVKHGGQRLALLDVDVLLAEIHVTGRQGNVFSRSHSGVNQDEHVFHAFHRINRFPQLSYLAGVEWPFDVNGNVLRKLQKAAEVRFHNSVLHGVLKELAQEHTAFLFRAVPPPPLSNQGQTESADRSDGRMAKSGGEKDIYS